MSQLPRCVYQHRASKVCELLSGVICFVSSSFVRLAGQIEQHIVKFTRRCKKSASQNESVAILLSRLQELFHPTAADKEKERRALREWEQPSTLVKSDRDP